MGKGIGFANLFWGILTMVLLTLNRRFNCVSLAWALIHLVFIFRIFY